MTTSDFKIYDVHCHLLPGMDDGCKTVEESLQVLQRSSEQNIRAIAATPHYYPKETVSNFLARRRLAAQALVEGITNANIRHPAVYLGAEVAYHSGLIYEEQLERLCIGQSNYLLLELPFSKWQPSVLRDVRTIRGVRGIVPIIAHLERYLKLQDKRTIEELLDCDALIQMNAEYILNPKTKRMAKKLLKRGVVQLLGSDCHNMTSRPPNLGLAYEQLLDWNMVETARKLDLNSISIFKLRASQ